MAQKAIREADGKRMLARWLGEISGGDYSLEDKYLTIDPGTDLPNLAKQYPWLEKETLVVKPDQLIKRRGKGNLLLLNASWEEASRWIGERMKQPVTVENISGILDHFIVEPFIAHPQEAEYYVAILSNRAGDQILFYHEGGINVGDVDSKAQRMQVNIDETPTSAQIEKQLLSMVPTERKALIGGFMAKLYEFYAALHFTYLEINPFIVCGQKIIPLDMAAKLDDTAEFLCGAKWGVLSFPSPFGRSLSKEEAYIEDLDSKTGASLKLTVLNPEGRIWTMVAGGGASVIYADTITDLGYMNEMANYGEYSGDPNEEFTYLYAKTILDLMTRKKDPRGKVLIIGGGIANFTDVANTFKGIIRALREYKEKLRDHKVKIYVRRGGPNYKEGLKNMEKLGLEIGVPIEVHGPEMHMTRIVAMALKENQ